MLMTFFDKVKCLLASIAHGDIQGIFSWLGELVVDGVVVGVKVITANNTIFIVIMMVGGFYIMFGQREKGVKLTSGSVLGYLICEVIKECL